MKRGIGIIECAIISVVYHFIFPIKDKTSRTTWVREDTWFGVSALGWKLGQLFTNLAESQFPGSCPLGIMTHDRHPLPPEEHRPALRVDPNLDGVLASHLDTIIRQTTTPQ